MGTSASAFGTAAIWLRPSIAPTSNYRRRYRPSCLSSVVGCLSSRSRRADPSLATEDYHGLVSSPQCVQLPPLSLTSIKIQSRPS